MSFLHFDFKQEVLLILIYFHVCVFCCWSNWEQLPYHSWLFIFVVVQWYHFSVEGRYSWLKCFSSWTFCQSPTFFWGGFRQHCTRFKHAGVLSCLWKLCVCVCVWLPDWELSVCQPSHVNFKSQLGSTEHVAAKGKALHCHQHHAAASGCCAIWH